MQDTWGISGPTFIAWYAGALVVVAVFAAIHRKVLFRGTRDARVGDLGPQQIAFLNGGDRLAIYAAMSGLRAADALGTGPHHTLKQTGPLPAGVTTLDAAIHNAAGRNVRSRDVAADQWTRSALDHLREDLERRGLANSRQTIRTARAWAVLAGVLLVVGLFRLYAGLSAGKPVALLVLALVGGFFLAVVIARTSRIPTDAARHAMRELRTRHGHLAPRYSPSIATYGVTGAAMGVALFGTASLFAMDPAFAAEAEIQRAAAAGYGGSSSSSGGGGSCGGGSSCGGGGGGGCGG